MVNECYEYLLSLKNYSNVVREVPFFSRCIDMVMITQENETITIEFKIKDWRHALVQVKSHKLGADKAYICLPIKTPSKNLLDALTKEQVGLYLYSPSEQATMHEYFPAPKNTRKIDAFASLLQKKINFITENSLAKEP